MKLKNAEKGISLIALIITIIVIIILAVIVIGVAMRTPESANKAKYLGDLSEIQQAVAIKRAENLMPTINNIEADMNDGFTKITMKRPGETDAVDGWVVNLNNVGIKNSTLGNGYNEIVEGGEIVFGANAPDVYVYDQNGEVFYSKGFVDGDNTIYSQTLINDNTIVEAENPDDWEFDSGTGTITKYVGPDIDTLIIPNQINKIKVNKIEGESEFSGILTGRTVGNVIISKGITSLEEYAFSWSGSLADITIPEGVTKIGYYAFSYSTNLVNVSVPSTVASIEDHAFYGCSKLESIIIPNNVNLIGLQTFGFCGSLTDITIPNSVTYIDLTAFQGCTNITQITLNMAEDLVTMAPWGATNAAVTWTGDPYVNFEDASNWTFNTSTGILSKYIGKTNVKDLIVPEYIGGIKVKELSTTFAGITSGRNTRNITVSEGIEKIGSNAFAYSTDLESVTIENGVSSIGFLAFYNSGNVKEIILPNSVTSIEAAAFSGCTSLEKITIPSSVITIGDSAFSNCTSLR